MTTAPSQNYREANFDGLVGPTHNYAGLAHGNLASAAHRHEVSHPRVAALQGLAKMKFVADQGVPQFVLPPHRRPWLPLLQQAGFRGSAADQVAAAAAAEPALLSASYSASNMWTANAATVSPSPDSRDGKLHLTPANLISGLHRSLEANETWRILRQIFSNQGRFHVHEPLPCTSYFSDEGAANHTRLGSDPKQSSLELFAFGFDADDSAVGRNGKFHARQSKQACEAIIRRHQLDPERCVLARQSSRAIDAGVFHNDVISVGHQNVFLVHELAFESTIATLDSIADKLATWDREPFVPIVITQKQLPLEDAVASYLFNSQLINIGLGQMMLICPGECQSNQAAHECVSRILADDNPIEAVEYFDLRESMRNGGGPACLRLRVVMNDDERAAVHPGVELTDERYAQLVACVEKNYRLDLRPADLADPTLIVECQRTFDELSEIFGLEV